LENEYSWAIHLNSFGLGLDILGVLIFFLFRPMPVTEAKLQKWGAYILDKKFDDEQTYNAGLVAIILGFSLQIISNYF